MLKSAQNYQYYLFSIFNSKTKLFKYFHLFKININALQALNTTFLIQGI